MADFGGRVPESEAWECGWCCCSSCWLQKQLCKKYTLMALTFEWMSVGLDVLRDTMQSVRDWWWGGGDQVPVISLFEMLQPAKLGKTDCHHQNKRYEGGGDLASAKQLAYCTACYEGGGTSPVQSSLCTAQLCTKVVGPRQCKAACVLHSLLFQ